jgi:hypothetical protein
MARPPKVPHLVGTNKILQLEDVYRDIGDICGINKLVDAPPADAETSSIRLLIANGTIRRAVVKISNGGSRVIYITAANCPKVGALRTLTYATGLTITRSWFPQRITMY